MLSFLLFTAKIIPTLIHTEVSSVLAPVPLKAGKGRRGKATDMPSIMLKFSHFILFKLQNNTMRDDIYKNV